jgi:hypothetical protein
VISAPTPFFLVGCGRSGTSLLRGLLNAHPLLAIPLESLFIADYLRAAGRWPLERIKALIAREPELREWGLEVGAADLAGCESVGQVIVRLHELYARSKGKIHWGQKTPRLVRHLPLLADHFPQARFIHLVRDPRAVVSSLIRSDVHRSTPWHGARRWVVDVGAGLRYEQQQPHRILRLSYERLVEAPEPTVREIMRFVGMEFAPAQLQAGAGAGEYSEFYDNIHANLEGQVSGRFVEQWRDHLTAGEVALVEKLAAPLMETLGYVRETEGLRPATPTALRTAWQRLRGTVLQLWRYLRYRRAYLFHLVRRKWRMGLLGEFLGEIYY